MNMNEMLGLVHDICGKRAVNMADGRPKRAILEFILALKVDHRMYMLTDETIRQLWTLVRENPDVTDFVMGGSVEFRARSCAKLLDWNQLVEILGYSFASSNPGEARDKSYIDADMQGRLGQRSELETAFTRNGWLVFVVLLEMLDIDFSSLNPTPPKT